MKDELFTTLQRAGIARKIIQAQLKAYAFALNKVDLTEEEQLDVMGRFYDDSFRVAQDIIHLIKKG